MNFQSNEFISISNCDNSNGSEICLDILSNLSNADDIKTTLKDLASLLVKADSKSSTRKYLLDKINLYLKCLNISATSIKSQLSQFKQEENINGLSLQTPDFIIINSKVVVLLNSNKDNIIETLLSRAMEFESGTMESNLILIGLDSYLSISDY
ncbi:MAG: hypothetical protein V3575_03265 [Candidatus Absconditabacteria bacterium]